MLKRDLRSIKAFSSIWFSPREISYEYDKNKINVVCIGGSITLYSKDLENNSYSYFLQEILGEQFKVTNLGLGGGRNSSYFLFKTF